MKLRLTLYVLLILHGLTCARCSYGQQTGRAKYKSMITFEAAQQKAIDTVAQLMHHDKDVVLWAKETITRPYGWYFIFTTKKYIESRSPHDIKFGVPHVFVSKDGKLEVVPTSIPLQSFIDHKDEQAGQQEK